MSLQSLSVDILDRIAPAGGWQSDPEGLSNGFTLPCDTVSSSTVLAELKLGDRRWKVEVIRAMQDSVNFSDSEKVLFVAQVWRETHRLEASSGLDRDEEEMLRTIVEQGWFPLAKTGESARWHGITTLFTRTYWESQSSRDERAVKKNDQFFEWTLRSKGDPTLLQKYPEEIKFLRSCGFDGRVFRHGCENLLREYNNQLEIRVEKSWVPFSNLDTYTFEYKANDIRKIVDEIERLSALVGKCGVSEDRRFILENSHGDDVDLNSGRRFDSLSDDENDLMELLHANGWRIEARGKSNEPVINFGHVSYPLTKPDKILGFSRVTLREALLEVKALKWRVTRFSVDSRGVVPWHVGRWEYEGRKEAPPPIRTVTAEMLQANGGLLHEGSSCCFRVEDLKPGEALVMAIGSRTMERSMSGHAWIRVYRPNDHGGYDVYSYGFMPKRQPKGAVESFKYMAHPDLATTIVSPDQSEYRRDRDNCELGIVFGPDELDQLMGLIDRARNECQSRERPFETLDRNCSHFVWESLSAVAGRDLDRFFEMNVFDTQSPGLMNYLKAGIGGIKPVSLRQFVVTSMLQLFRIAPIRYRKRSMELMHRLIGGRFGEEGLADVPSAILEYVRQLEKDGVAMPARLRDLVGEEG